MNPMDTAKFYKLTISKQDGSPYMTLHVAGERMRITQRTYLEEGFKVEAEPMDSLPEGVEPDVA